MKHKTLNKNYKVIVGSFNLVLQQVNSGRKLYGSAAVASFQAKGSS